MLQKPLLSNDHCWVRAHDCSPLRLKLCWLYCIYRDNIEYHDNFLDDNLDMIFSISLNLVRAFKIFYSRQRCHGSIVRNQEITTISVSLWLSAYARNVRLYYRYRQYTNLFIFQFVFEHCLRRTLCLFHILEVVPLGQYTHILGLIIRHLTIYTQQALWLVNIHAD